MRTDICGGSQRASVSCQARGHVRVLAVAVRGRVDARPAPTRCKAAWQRWRNGRFGKLRSAEFGCAFGAFEPISPCAPTFECLRLGSRPAIAARSGVDAKQYSVQWQMVQSSKQIAAK